MLEGVGKDTELVTNEKGGRQSKINYRFDLLPAGAVATVAKVLKEGAESHGENNWHSIPSSDHLNHALLHIFAYMAGDTQDDHAEHATCRIMMFMEMVLRERESRRRQ